MKTKTLSNTSLLFSVLVLLLTASSASAQLYGGRATGVRASINSGGTVNNYAFADTGDLPPGGGIVTATAPSSAITGVMGTGVLTATTSGALRSSQSVTVANDVLITVAGLQIRANRVTANAGCICCPGADLPTCSGSTNISQLTITDSAGNVTTVTANGQANQVVNLPDGAGTLTINQQINTSASITVNGLRVNASSGGTTYDIIVASSLSALECLVALPTAGPVTVSGRVLTADGSGISRATVTLTDDEGNVRSAATNSTGHFSFADVESGRTYVIGASHRTYRFTPRAINVTEDMAATDIVSN